jgi:hypothetical protein
LAVPSQPVTEKLLPLSFDTVVFVSPQYRTLSSFVDDDPAAVAALGLVHWVCRRERARHRLQVSPWSSLRYTTPLRFCGWVRQRPSKHSSKPVGDLRPHLASVESAAAAGSS